MTITGPCSPSALVFPLAALILFSGSLAAAPKKMPNPDFTKGESITEGYTHDWTLGATGARGWIYSYNLETTDARQIYVTEIAPGSPANGVLKVGDVILGVGGKPFSSDPRPEFGKALTLAESETGGGNLSLIRWRDGQTETVVVKLPVLGTYSATTPFDCPKSQKILELGCKALAERMKDEAYHKTQSAVTRPLNALALLASGDPEYLPLVKKEAEWASDFSAGGMAAWYYGYVMMLLSEYQIATGDNSFMPGLERLAMETSNGQSSVGSWGHRFADPNGRLYGYGMMNSPGIPLTTGLVMARMAGVKEPKIDLAIERSARLLRFYIGKGAIPYGDHQPWIQNHDDNGKCGMAAVLFNIMKEEKGAKFFSRMSVACHGPERDTGHTGNFWNITWAMPGVVQSGPQAAGAWMQEFGAWYFDFARSWDGSSRHQGPPSSKPDSTGRWDTTGAYLLAYAMPLKKIVLTGKLPPTAPQIDAATAQQLILDGRDWSINDRYSAYDQLSGDTLLERLGSWSPIVRERAATAIGRRGDAPIPALIAMLDSPSLDARLGACQMLARLKTKSEPAVPALLKTLRADDLWLRINAAKALAAIGKPAMPAVPELLQILSKGPTEGDPRGMEQRYLCSALFSKGSDLLGNSLEGVDRKQLLAAVRAGLHNEDGAARGALSSVYSNLTFEELKPLLPAIHEAIVKPAPSGIMFADQIQTAGLQLFAKYHVSEGIELIADYARTQKPHSSQKRIFVVMDMLKCYGAHARRVIPELEATAKYFENDETDFPKHLSLQKAKCVRDAIAFIKASEDKPELTRL